MFLNLNIHIDYFWLLKKISTAFFLQVDNHGERDKATGHIEEMIKY